MGKRDICVAIIQKDLVNRLSSLLEPFLIGFLGITIGLIVISILLPMFDVIGNINKVM